MRRFFLLAAILSFYESTALSEQCDGARDCSFGENFMSFTYGWENMIRSSWGKEIDGGFGVTASDTIRPSCLVYTPVMVLNEGSQVQITARIKSHWSSWASDYREAQYRNTFKIRIVYKESLNSNATIVTEQKTVHDLGFVTQGSSHPDGGYYFASTEGFQDFPIKLNLKNGAEDFKVSVCEIWEDTRIAIDSIEITSGLIN